MRGKTEENNGWSSSVLKKGKVRDPNREKEGDGGFTLSEIIN